jgi:endo-1,4-beta-xylanase
MKKFIHQKRKKLSIIAVFAVMVITLLSIISCKSDNKVKEKPESIPSLCESYKDFFTIGVALSTRDLNDSLTMLRAKEHFNSITSENSMKWEKIHPQPGVYDFVNSDQFVEFGIQNNMEIIGHVLVWHQQTPSWVFEDGKGNQVSRDTLLKRMQDHIYTVVGRYKGKVKCWDVVNEAIDDDGRFRQNTWARIIGEDYVLKAFQYAHEADSSALLIYNDYSLPTPNKRDGVIKLIADIKEQGARVDVIGMQGHYHLDYPLLSELEESIVAFSALGCKVHFTEMDVNILPKIEDYHGADISVERMYSAEFNPWPDSLPDSMQTVLADRYASFFEIFIRQKDIIDRVTIWGMQDGNSWLNEWPIRGRANYPLLFDRSYKPKKAFWALIELAGKEEEAE